jgi:hypothetical protein
MALLLPEETKQLTLALGAAFTTQGSLDDLTRLQMSTPLADITPSDTMPEMIKRIVVWAETEGRTEELIRNAMAAVPGNDVLRIYGGAIRERLAKAQPLAWYRAPADPHETCFVTGPKAFISRDTLRTFMREFRDPLGKTVLVVNGVSKTGKTFSLQLLAYVRKALQQKPNLRFGLASVDLEDEVRSTYEPEMLASDIAGQLGWSTDSMPKRPSTRYGKELCRWLVGQSNQRPDEVVAVVLDGFHYNDLHSETRDMAQEFVRQVCGNTSNIRLFLLNFPESLVPANTPATLQPENVALINTTELTDFFTLLYRQKGMPPDKQVIDLIVQSVVTKVPVGAPNYNELLNQSATDAAMRLK